MTYFFDTVEGDCTHKGRVFNVVDKKTKEHLWWEISCKTYSKGIEICEGAFAIFDEERCGNPLTLEEKERALIRKVKV